MTEVALLTVTVAVKVDWVVIYSPSSRLEDSSGHPDYLNV